MPKIRIERDTNWTSGLRRIDIYIDGEKTDTINDGETKDFDVENGTHEIYVKLGWERSQKIELNTIENQIIVLKLTQLNYLSWWLLFHFVITFLYYLGKDTLNFKFYHYLILIGIPALCFIYYIYIIKKNKLFILSEIDKINV
jgi:hypothetical protein